MTVFIKTAMIINRSNQKNSIKSSNEMDNY